MSQIARHRICRALLGSLVLAVPSMVALGFAATPANAAAVTFRNDTDFAIADNSTVNSPVFSNLTGTVASTVQVAVDILHTYRGDLVVSVIDPTGAVAGVLSNRAGGSADNLIGTFTVNATGRPAGGTWTLRVTDAAAQDTGTLRSWSITFPDSAPPSTHTFRNDTDFAIADNSTVNSPVFSNLTGTVASTVQVAVDILHTYRGDLVVSVIDPTGAVAGVLSNRAGGSADNLIGTFTVNATGRPAGGTWTLRVTDAATQDTGTLRSWSITFP